MITKTEIIRILHLDNSQCRKLRSSTKRKRFQSKYGNERNDVVARAIRVANRYILNGGLSVKDSEMNDPSLEEAKEFELGNENYKKGWARRLKVDGGVYGRTYIQSFKDDVELLFQRGNLNSSEKMNPAQIRESLEEKYPNLFSIPSETKIKQEIGLLFSKSKESSVGGTKSKQNKNKGKKSTIILHLDGSNTMIDWLQVLEEVVKENKCCRPEVLYSRFILLMTETHAIPIDDIPRRHKLKQKISSLKSRYKKEAMNSVV